MQTTLLIVQMIVSVVLVLAILLQGRGAGLGASFGGGGEFYRSKRGIERLLFKATIILMVVFFLSSLAMFIFS